MELRLGVARARHVPDLEVVLPGVPDGLANRPAVVGPGLGDGGPGGIGEAAASARDGLVRPRPHDPREHDVLGGLGERRALGRLLRKHAIDPAAYRTPAADRPVRRRRALSS